MSDASIEEQLLAALRNDDVSQRLQALGAMRDNITAELVGRLVSLLRHSEPTLRRRAGSALSFFQMSGVELAGHAALLADYLTRGTDERVRLSCAAVLMSVSEPEVTRAFLVALNDSDEKIAMIACLEVGDRGGVDGTEALFAMLNHPNWSVRLEACKALITQQCADRRVVSTLEAMSQEPEAMRYDQETDESRETMEEFIKVYDPEGTCGQCWGRLESILARARQVATSSSAG